MIGTIEESTDGVICDVRRMFHEGEDRVDQVFDLKQVLYNSMIFFYGFGFENPYDLNNTAGMWDVSIFFSC